MASPSLLAPTSGRSRFKTVLWIALALTALFVFITSEVFLVAGYPMYRAYRLQVIADRHLLIPHTICGPSEHMPPVEQVLLVIGEHRVAGFDTVICDVSVSLEFMQLFETVVHFILRDDEEKRQESRLLWQKMRDLGLQPVHIPYGRQP